MEVLSTLQIDGMVLNFRGFDLSEHVTCEKALSKPFSWVKDPKSQLKEVQGGFSTDFWGCLCPGLELFHKPWPNFRKAFNAEDERHSRAEKDSILRSARLASSLLTSDRLWREPFHAV